MVHVAFFQMFHCIYPLDADADCESEEACTNKNQCDTNNSVNDIDVLGSEQTRLCSEEERAALDAVGCVLDENEHVSVYERMRKDGNLFATARYRRETITRNNRIVLFKNNGIGELIDIFQIENNCYLMIKWLALQNADCFVNESSSKASHLRRCTGYVSRCSSC